MTLILITKHCTFIKTFLYKYSIIAWIKVIYEALEKGDCSLYKSNLHSLRFSTLTFMLDLWFTFFRLIELRSCVCACVCVFSSLNLFYIFIVWKLIWANKSFLYIFFSFLWFLLIILSILMKTCCTETLLLWGKNQSWPSVKSLLMLLRAI